MSIDPPRVASSTAAAQAVETIAVPIPAERRRLTRRLPLLSVGIAICACLFALVGPYFAPHTVAETVGAPYSGPGEAGVLGTDFLGRDLWSRVLAGGQRLLILTTLATIATCVVGGILGLLAGYVRGRLDGLIMRLADILLLVPMILVVLIFVTSWGASTLVLVIATVTIQAPLFARIARAATLEVAQREYVEAAVARGERTAAILRREILPNVVGPLLASAGLQFVGGIYIIATASFLGFGAEPPAADWARMISENKSGVTIQPWPVAVPALLIVVLSASVNLAADAVHRRFASGSLHRGPSA